MGTQRKSVRRSAGVEALECRRHLSTTVTQDGSTLTIQGDAGVQNVEIYESDSGSIHQTRLLVDANGNGTFTDPGDINGAIYSGVTNLVVRLGGGNDSLKIVAADPLINATRNYDIRTGAGSNTVSFTNPVGNDIRGSNISMTFNGGNGSNTVNLALNRIDTSTFQANLATGGGNDAVTLYGGQKVSNSTVIVNADLGAGNDTFTEELDWEGFGLLGAATKWQVSAAGGDGNDTLAMSGMSGHSGSILQGTLDTSFAGNAGNDSIAFNLDRFTLQGGIVRLRGGGGANDDVLSFAGTINTGYGGGTLDAQLVGGKGNDTFTSTVDASPSLTYTPSTGVLFDGGLGTNTGTFSGTLLRTLANIT